VPNELAALVGVGNVNLPCAEIYDSGCSKHLTPYCDALENFIEIPPKSFRAANKQNMTAVRMGEMTINLPDSADVSQLKLTEVLYSSEVSYTLVSVGQLNVKGFEIIFSGGKCTEELTLDQFHHQMGHILAGVTHCLVKNGFVTGICLELTSS